MLKYKTKEQRAERALASLGYPVRPMRQRFTDAWIDRLAECCNEDGSLVQGAGETIGAVWKEYQESLAANKATEASE